MATDRLDWFLTRRSEYRHFTDQPPVLLPTAGSEGKRVTAPPRTSRSCTCHFIVASCTVTAWSKKGKKVILLSVLDLEGGSKLLQLQQTKRITSFGNSAASFCQNSTNRQHRELRHAASRAAVPIMESMGLTLQCPFSPLSVNI